MRSLKCLSLSQMQFIWFCAAILVCLNQVSTSIVDCDWTHKDSGCDMRIEDDCFSDTELCEDEKMCIEYHKIANNLCKHSDLDVRDVTHLSHERPEQGLNYSEGSNNYIQNDCPEIEDLNLQSNKSNESGFSPWKYVINRDYNRIPRDILETNCTCEHCLVPQNSTTANLQLNYAVDSYVSRPLMVTRYFHMKNNCTKVFHAEFSYGCICEYDGVLHE